MYLGFGGYTGILEKKMETKGLGFKVITPDNGESNGEEN